MLLPACGRVPQDPRGAIGLAAVGLCLWLVAAGPPMVGPEPTPAHVIAEQLLDDPDALLDVSVDYLDTSWRDTEGTVRTITGLAALFEAAAQPGPRGAASRGALDRVDAALGIVHQQSPALAVELRQAVARHGLPSANAAGT